VARSLPAVHDVDSYLQVRARDSQLRGYYQKNSRVLDGRINRLKVGEIALALAAAALAAVASVSPSVGARAAVATTAAGAMAAFIASQRYEFLWVEYSRTASELRRLLERRTAADGRQLSGPELVAECEQVISVQNQAWMAKWGEEDSGSGHDG
jgi:SMODS and SLOG-associating 2TM effector domain 1